MMHLLQSSSLFALYISIPPVLTKEERCSPILAMVDSILFRTTWIAFPTSCDEKEEDGDQKAECSQLHREVDAFHPHKIFLIDFAQFIRNGGVHDDMD